MKRNIRYIVVHCTATAQDISINSLRQAWKEAMQCEAPPFHYVIEKDGEIARLLHENCITGGDFPHNEECMHVAYIGGMDKAGKPADTRTTRQKDALFGKLVELTDRYPQAEIVGSGDINGVSDPFDVKRWMENYLPDLSERPYFEDYESEEEEIAA